MTIEGILESLRFTKNYAEMTFFINTLEKIETSSTYFKIQVQCVIFLYTLFPLLDAGRFEECKKLIENNQELYDKSSSLILTRRAELLLYTSLVFFGNKEYGKAKKTISQIFIDSKSFYSLPIFRTIRLVNLLIQDELNEYAFIDSEMCSMKREIQNKVNDYQTELLIFKILNIPLNSLSKLQREKLWKKTESDFQEIKQDKFERQLLCMFDFLAWIESIIKKIPLQEILGSTI